MTARSSGLQRDLHLIRRRAWLFIPFFLLGVLVAIAYGSFAGNSNAVASLQLSTVVHDYVTGGDRGFRIFEAEAMTHDDAFKQEVRDAIGDKNFDYARFTIALAPISVADGVSEGTLTVSIKDARLANAEKYRQAWVGVFTREYMNPDGMFRQRFVGKKQQAADDAEKAYQAAYAKLKQMAAGKNLPLDQLVQWNSPGAMVSELGKQEAQLMSRQVQVQAAIDALGSATPATAAAVASSVLGQPVPSGEGLNTLNATNTALKSSLQTIRQQVASYSDGSFDPALLQQIDDVRGADNAKLQALGQLNNVRAVIGSAESTVDTTYSASGGLAGSTLGRVAIVLAVTIVFGLIAIYGIEWLSQIRNKLPD